MLLTTASVLLAARAASRNWHHPNPFSTEPSALELRIVLNRLCIKPNNEGTVIHVRHEHHNGLISKLTVRRPSVKPSKAFLGSGPAVLR